MLIKELLCYTNKFKCIVWCIFNSFIMSRILRNLPPSLPPSLPEILITRNAELHFVVYNKVFVCVCRSKKKPNIAASSPHSQNSKAIPFHTNNFNILPYKTIHPNMFSRALCFRTMWCVWGVDKSQPRFDLNILVVQVEVCQANLKCIKGMGWQTIG